MDAFPVDQQEQIRSQLSTSLLAVISQILMPRADKTAGIIAGFEIMMVTPAIEHLIRESQTHKITSSIQTGAQQGMILLDDFLYNLFLQKKITYQVMMQSAQNPGDLQAKIKQQSQTSARKR